VQVNVVFAAWGYAQTEVSQRIQQQWRNYIGCLQPTAGDAITRNMRILDLSKLASPLHHTMASGGDIDLLDLPIKERDLVDAPLLQLQSQCYAATGVVDGTAHQLLRSSNTPRVRQHQNPQSPPVTVAGLPKDKCNGGPTGKCCIYFYPSGMRVKWACCGLTATTPQCHKPSRNALDLNIISSQLS
jgi:hypothetical protein